MDPVADGWHALSAGEWQRARECFEQAVAAQEAPQALEGLGWAGYFLGDDRLTFDARERAYRCYRERGDASSAARVAVWLAADCLEFRGEPAVANGWFQRAHSLLDDLEPGPDHGWLAVHEAEMVMGRDPETGRRLAESAVDLGRRFGVPELEMLGLGIAGLALVSEGRLDEGMQRLDEATAAALAGEATLLICVGWACCYLIAGCEQVRDYDRAGQWCERIGAFCDRHGIASLLGVCRTKYAGVLTWQGRWDDAEAELTSAADTLASRPGLMREVLVRLAALRRRQGRLDEAEALYARCAGSPLAVLGRAEIALDRGELEEAAELADRFLRRFGDTTRMERCPGLEVAVRANVRLRRLEPAHEALQQLRDIAARAGTAPLKAAALVAEATLAGAGGHHDAARRRLEDAVDLLAEGQAPYELAEARLELAAALRALGRPRAARRELEAAVAAFRDLGATRAAARAESALTRLRPDPVAAHGPLASLTPREREVLALVADGCTNPEVAARLVLSEHTVHRHVANILRKLEVPSRTAAASLAGRYGLE